MSFDMGQGYAVLVEERQATSSAGMNLPWTVARDLTRQLRADGRRAYIMRLSGKNADCIVAADEDVPVDEPAASPEG